MQNTKNKKEELKNKAHDKWDSLGSSTKKKVVLGSIVFIFIILVLFSTNDNKKGEVYKETALTKRESIVLEPEFTEIDILSNVESQIENLRSEMSSLGAENEALKEKVENAASGESTTIIMSNNDKANKNTSAQNSKSDNNLYPEPPPPIKQSVPLFENKPDPNLAQALLKSGPNGSKNETRFIGSIMHVQGVAPQEENTKKKDQVYLPPSHMPAVLMTGLKAHTIKGASKNPSQVMLRIQKPAILPNFIKAQLSGCFVIAEGYGRLDTQRVELRTVSLSCLSKGGKSVIDQEIDGFVVDSDGSIGLAGHVYSYMDKSIGYAFAAGAIGGFGEHYSASNSTVQTSPLGTTTTYDPSSSVRNGFAQGIGDASDELKDIYLDIVKQAAPVIEVGPTKKVTIIISKGAYLQIKKLES